jgi:hypothetical protein
MDGIKAMRFDDLPRNMSWGALQYNCGRELCAYVEDRKVPASTGALRVLSVLTAAWAIGGTGRCDPLAGHHDAHCAHQSGGVRYTRQWLAREAFGAVGGSQRAQVTKALAELSSPEYGCLDEHEEGICPVITLRTAQGEALRADGSGGVVIFDPVLADSLLLGHFQRLPIELVRDLRASAFRTWLYVLMRARAARTRKSGQWVDVAVTGRRSSADFAYLGMRRLRADRIRRSLERYAEEGNGLQSEWRLEVVDRAQGGVKLRLTRLEPRSAARRLRRAA